MNGADGGCTDDQITLVERRTLCISRPKPDYVLHAGDHGFREELGAWYDAAESNAAEKLVRLKAALRQAKTEEFWTMATEGLADLTGAQYGFISKRMLVDEEDAAVEMPPLGEPGSCLMSQALYFNDGHGKVGNPRNVKYIAYGCPCAHMKHDKVFIIPERFNDVIPNNPNKASFVVPAEAYLAVPLTYEGRCFAHFGVMWSVEGLARRKLSFAYIEMMFHALEDTILDGFLERTHFFPKAVKTQQQPKAVIPHEVITATQSLKPYARSLSHELRTPMQGVVGMLDVMYATVQEASEGQNDPHVRAVLRSLRDNIEVIQGNYQGLPSQLRVSLTALTDSSRRAVEAADNVVHAYDMNMGVPESPISPTVEEDAPNGLVSSKDKRPNIVVTGDYAPINLKSHKRRRSSVAEPIGMPSKRNRTEGPSQASSQRSMHTSHAFEISMDYQPSSAQGSDSADVEISARAKVHSDNTSNPSFTPEHSVPHGLRHTNLRDVLQYLINDLLKVGGRPDSAIAHDTEHGEEIEVRVRNSSGEEKLKLVQWSVDPSVPETILIDEKDLTKMVSCVFLNALKFTEEGRITLTTRLSPKLRYVVINIRDTGPGIPEAFLPNLFKPFSKEDDSTTRHSEGLGLGLLVAKGLARKLGGDLTCIRSDTSGANRGTEFEMRVPCTPSDAVSRPGTPFSSPTPSHRSLHSADLDSMGPTPFDPLAAHHHHHHHHYHHYTASTTISPSSPRPSSRQSVRFHNARRHSPSPPASNQPITTTTTNSTKSTAPPPPPAAPHPPFPPLSLSDVEFDRHLASKYPLTFLVVEDNKINRKLLVGMLGKLGYEHVLEAYDGSHAVRTMERFSKGSPTSVGEEEEEVVDVVLMDLWMPYMDGYEATERILSMNYGCAGEDGGLVGQDHCKSRRRKKGPPTILAVTADVTDIALKRAEEVGMKGFLSKPYKLRDLQKLILEYCARLPSSPVSGR